MNHVTIIHTRGDTYSFSEKELSLLLRILYRSMEERPKGNYMRTQVENEVAASGGTFNVFTAIHEIREALCGTGTFDVCGRHILVALALKKNAPSVSKDNHGSTVIGGVSLNENEVSVLLESLYEILAYGSTIVIERNPCMLDGAGDNMPDEDQTWSGQVEASTEVEVEYNASSEPTKKQRKLRALVDEVNAMLAEPANGTDLFIVKMFSDVIPVFKIVEEHKKRVTIEFENSHIGNFIGAVYLERATVNYARRWMASTIYHLSDLLITEDIVGETVEFISLTPARVQYQNYVNALGASFESARRLLLSRRII